MIDNFHDSLRDIKDSFVEKLNTVQSLEDLKQLKSFTSKSLGGIFKSLSDLSDIDKKSIGIEINNLRDFIKDNLNIKNNDIRNFIMADIMNANSVDVTLPCREREIGSIHPISAVMHDIVAFLKDSMGFSVVSGNEIDTEYNVFDALNTPKHHPAREMQDTFYINNNKDLNNRFVLRTHTSSAQVKSIKKYGVPIKIICPGRVFRVDLDATHTPMFHQIEGLYIDKIENVSMGHLKYCIEGLLSYIFNDNDIEFRYRSSFFPFTEPSLEVDIRHKKAIKGKESWVEILGCGMVHPNIIRNVGVDINSFGGFAFGLGIERIAMMKYGISDLRDVFGPDFRWLTAFGMNII